MRAPLERSLTQLAGVPVALGRADARFLLKLFWRPRLEVAALTVGAAPGPAAPYLLSAENLRLSWLWSDAWPWWLGRAGLRLQSLDASRLDLYLLRGADGLATWQVGGIGRPLGSRDAAAAARHDPVPLINTLTVGAGRIVLDDQPLATRIVATVEGSEGAPNGSATTASGWRAQVDGQWKSLPLVLDIVTAGALPLLEGQTDPHAAAASVALRVKGRVNATQLLFDGHAGALLDARRLSGELKLAGPSLATVGVPLGLTLPHTPPFELEGHLAHDGTVWQLLARRASVGKSRLGGDFKFDTHPVPPELSGRLTGTRLALADLGPAIGAPIRGSAAADPAPRSDRVLPQRRFDLASLRAMNADLALAIDELDFGTDALAPLRGLSGRLVLVGGRLELQQLKAVVAGGSLSGTSAYDASVLPARWTARMRFAGVDVAGWLRRSQTPQAAAAPPAAPTQAAKLAQERKRARKGGDQVARNYITGVFEADFDVRGSGPSTSEILSTLDGKAEMTLREGTLSHLITEAAGLDLAQGLGVFLRGDRPLPLRCARVRATAHNGLVRTTSGVIDNADSTLRLAGELNLKDESLALVVRALPKDFSPLTLRTPLTVHGTLARPVIGVDGGKLAAKLGAAAVLGAALGPFGALIALVDFGSREEGDPCASAPQAKPAGDAASAPAAR